MTFLDKLEDIIQTAYFLIIKKNSIKEYTNVLNCNSYAFIINEIKKILIECNRQGFDALGTANTIIYELLQRNYFVFNNHVMAAFIGYQYLKINAEVKNRFSAEGINNNSTIEDIGKLTMNW